MNKFYEFLNKHLNVIVIVTLIVTIASPFVFTQFVTGVNFMKTGNIGDTIGGLTAPFLNVLNILLLYLTLRGQNVIADKQNDVNTVLQLFNSVKNDFESLKLYKSSTPNETLTGAKPLFDLAHQMQNTNNLNSYTDEQSLKAFNISVVFLISNIHQLLATSKSSSIDMEMKERIYSTMNQIATPLKMYTKTKEIYYKKKYAQTKSTIDQNEISMSQAQSIAIEMAFNGMNSTEEHAKP